METECVGAAVLDAFDNAGIDVGGPAVRLSEVILDEECDDSFDGSELVASVQRPEEVRLHGSDVVQPSRHGHSFDFGKGAA